MAPWKYGSSAQLERPMYIWLRTSVFSAPPLLVGLATGTPLTKTATWLAALTVMAKCVQVLNGRLTLVFTLP